MNANQLAKHWGMHRCTVTRYRDRGMPFDADGQIELAAAEKWKRENVRPRGRPARVEDEDLRAARLREAIAQADIREVQAGKAQGEMVETQAVIDTWYGCTMAVRDLLLGIPDRLAEAVAAEDDEHVVAEMMRAEITAALASLQDSPPEVG